MYMTIYQKVVCPSPHPLFPHKGSKWTILAMCDTHHSDQFYYVKFTVDRTPSLIQMPPPHLRNSTPIKKSKHIHTTTQSKYTTHHTQIEVDKQYGMHFENNQLQCSNFK